jgi:hypothetical protein
MEGSDVIGSVAAPWSVRSSVAIITVEARLRASWAA